MREGASGKRRRPQGVGDVRRPLAEASHAPGLLYASPEIFRREVERVFMRDWLFVARTEELPESGDYLTLRIARAFDETEKRRQSFIAGITDDRLQERIAYENLKGERWEYSLGHMLQHVVNHSTYHRGQIVTLLRQLGAAGVSTDFLLYFDEGHQPQQ